MRALRTGKHAIRSVTSHYRASQPSIKTTSGRWSWSRKKSASHKCRRTRVILGYYTVPMTVGKALCRTTGKHHPPLELTVRTNCGTPITPILIGATSSIKLAVPLCIANSVIHTGLECTTTMCHGTICCIARIPIGVDSLVWEIAQTMHQSEQEVCRKVEDEGIEPRRHIGSTMIEKRRLFGKRTQQRSL